jgi:hypothetical protein
MRGFRPTSPRTHERRGRCTLCGSTADLTQTHVPPQAAFNSGKARRSVVSTDNFVTLDRARDGGFRVWGHCDDCRRATSPWDNEYITWANALTNSIVSSPHVGRRRSLVGSFPKARPGRFARAAIAGMTALAEGMVDSHPELIAAVRTGTPWEPTDDMRFLAGVTPRIERVYAGGGHRGVAVTVPLDSATATGSLIAKPTISAVVHHGPFSLLLVDKEIAPEFPHVDCTDWLAKAVEDEVLNFHLNLPAVKLSDDVAIAAGPGAFESTVI